jgi:hypothetical protein
MDNRIYNEQVIIVNNNDKINKLKMLLCSLYFYKDIDFKNKTRNIKIIEEKKDKNDNEFYYKTIIIGNLVFYYTNFKNGTLNDDHYLNINTYKIFGPDKNEKINEKYKNNISLLFDEINFKTLTEEMFIEYIKMVFNFLKI